MLALMGGIEQNSKWHWALAMGTLHFALKPQL